MFYLIRAQLKYIVYNLYSTLIILIGISSYAYIRDFNPLNLISFLLFVQFVSLVLLNNTKESREYIFRLIILSAKQVAITRIILVLLGFTTIYFVAFGLHVLLFNVAPGFRNSLQELFMFGGIALCGIFLYLFIADYFSIFKSKSGFVWFNVIIGLLIGILSFAMIITVTNSYDSSAYSSQFIISGLYIIAAIFAGISFVTYQFRESYLGYK